MPQKAKSSAGTYGTRMVWCNVRACPSTTLPLKATPHPALIPQGIARSSRRYPAIPARPRARRPAHAANPRISPLRPEAPRPACHAGGRGFESRRSRKVAANRFLWLSGQVQATAGFVPSRTHPARKIAGQSRLEPGIPAGRTSGHIAGRPPRATSIQPAFAAFLRVGDGLPRPSRVASRARRYVATSVRTG